MTPYDASKWSERRIGSRSIIGRAHERHERREAVKHQSAMSAFT
jgi:hypothetical protein